MIFLLLKQISLNLHSKVQQTKFVVGYASSKLWKDGKD